MAGKMHTATIVSVEPKDGSQSGRYQIQRQIAQDSGTTSPEQTTEAVFVKPDAPFHTMGKTGTDFINGQTVYIMYPDDENGDGGQEPIIIGSVPNAEEEGKNDTAKNASWTTGISQWLQRTGTDPKTLSKAYQETYSSVLGGVNTFQDLKPANAVKMRSQLEAAIKKATRSGKDPIKDLEGTVRSVFKGGIEKGRYAATAKSINKSIGSFPFDAGDLTDPGKFIQSKLGKAGELIPNAMSMIQNLKSAVKSPGSISALSSVGGADIVQKALAGIANIKSESANNEFDLLAYLCELYEELFPGLDCKLNGEFTPAFEKWKKEYLLALRTEQGLV